MTIRKDEKSSAKMYILILGQQCRALETIAPKRLASPYLLQTETQSKYIMNKEKPAEH